MTHEKKDCKSNQIQRNEMHNQGRIEINELALQKILWIQNPCNSQNKGMVKSKINVIDLKEIAKNNGQNWIERNDYGDGQDKVQKDEDTKSDKKKDDIARESEGKHCNRSQWFIIDA